MVPPALQRSLAGVPDSKLFSVLAALRPTLDERIAACDGRTFETGDHCMIRLDKRTAKHKSPFSQVCKVLRRTGSKTYEVRKATRNVVSRPVERLKPFRMSSELFAHARVCRTFLARIATAVLDAPLPVFDVKHAPGQFSSADDWKGKTVWLSFPFNRRVPEALQAMADSEAKEIWIVVPDLQCEEWMTTANALQHTDWAGTDEGGDAYVDEQGRDQIKPIWVDLNGNRTASFPFAWWVGRFAPPE